MKANTKVPRFAQVAAVAAVLVVLVAVQGSAENPDVVIEGQEERCAADPQEVDTVQKACIKNELNGYVLIQFTGPVLVGSSTGPITDTISIPKGETVCVYIAPSTDTPLDVGYDVSNLKRAVCSGPPQARPRIIIHPPPSP
jgi:hypothetical protein